MGWNKPRYRVIRDDYGGFEAQVKYWYFPVWLELGFCNTHCSLKDALAYIEFKEKQRIKSKLKKQIVWEER